ncbi:MAG: hypothetical protein ACM3O3_00800 [Syntrophothermus sp.]
MRTIYIRKDINNFQRKILLDMAYLAEHNMIRLLKFYFEDNLYLPFYKSIKDRSSFDKFYLTRDKIVKEDDDHYFFKFPFKPQQVEGVD